MTLATTPLPVIDTRVCGVGEASGAGCRVCVDRCPYDAIEVLGRPDGAEVRIDAQLCQRCGACSGACPTSAIERPFLSDRELIEALGAASAPRGAVVITCPAGAELAASVVGSEQVVVTPSLLVLNETHLLAAIAAGAEGVLLLGCPRCTHDRPDLLRQPLSVARTVLAEPRQVAFVEDGDAGRLQAAVSALTAGVLAGGMRARVDADAVDVSSVADAPRRYERLRLLLPMFGSGTTAPLAAAGYGSVALDAQSCVACGACAVACPTDALVLDASVARLGVIDAACIGCGICASVCPDDAIVVESAIPIGAGALDMRILLEDESVACRNCGDRYAPRRLLEHARSVLLVAGLDPDDPQFQLGICPACRDIHARERSTAAIREDGGCGSSPPSRRSILKGAVVSAVAVGVALPLFGGRRSAFAVEEGPVIMPGRMGMVIDLDRCIGCHACTNVCKAENNVPLGKFRDWVEEHLLGEYPHARPVFLPKLCNHCDDPGCLRACPTGAIRKRPDGIVDLDPDICIACQACMQGCPYGMTFYNHQRGTADKCNLCSHRIDEGLDPACVEVCPSQCRIVGDFDDPESPVSTYLRSRDSDVLREDYGLGPNIRYVGLPGELDR